MLKVHNSLVREKQEFVPIVPGQVRMYVCGMTVYDYCHLGHGRMVVVFDMVQRWLRASGYDVTYVEHNSGHNYPSWRNILWRGLEHLYSSAK